MLVGKADLNALLQILRVRTRTHCSVWPVVCKHPACAHYASCMICKCRAEACFTAAHLASVRDAALPD